jgi:hypothetical protein
MENYESKECLECGCIIHPKVYLSICYDDGGGMECGSRLTGRVKQF